MKAEDLFEAIGRGIVKQLLAPEPAVTPTAMLPAKTDSPSGAATPPGEPSVIPGTVPTPSFDQVDEPLPGFEGIPRATLLEMEKAMEKITRGNTPPPGFYNPEDADQRAPLS